MANAPSTADLALIRNYFDKMLDVQSSIKELQLEYQQLLKDADVDGLERKALNPLINLLAAETRPRGEALLNKLIEYGRHAGLALVPGIDQPTVEPQPTPAVSTRDVRSSFARERKLLGDRTAAWLQAIIGLAAGGTLVWLLH